MVLVLFSFGLIGIVGLQAKAVQYSVSAEDSNRAALLASEIASAMELAQTVSLPSAAISAWQARVTNPAVAGLPNATASVVPAPAASSAQITITWRAPSATVGAANSTNQYVTQVILP